MNSVVQQVNKLLARWYLKKKVRKVAVKGENEWRRKKVEREMSVCELQVKKEEEEEEEGRRRRRKKEEEGRKKEEEGRRRRRRKKEKKRKKIIKNLCTHTTILDSVRSSDSLNSLNTWSSLRSTNTS